MSHSSKKNILIYGKHSVQSVLQHRPDALVKLWVSEQNGDFADSNPALKIPPIICNNAQIDSIFRQDKHLRNTPISHQGIAAMIRPKIASDIDFIDEQQDCCTVAILDNISDVQNIGSIIRSAAAFNIKAVLIDKRYEILNTPSIYKTSVGMIELVNIVYFTNLAQTLQTLKQQGFWIIGMQKDNSINIKDIDHFDKKAIILGSEAKGLRDLTKKHCDLFARIDISPECESLNVSNAAAIAMFCLAAK